MIRRDLIRSAAAATLVGLIGCSGGGPEYGEVEGTVTLKGQPLANVEIVFMPDAESGTNGQTASGYTDERGHYRLWCEPAGLHGAVVGTHRVCVHDIAAMPLPPLEAGATDGAGKAYRPQPLRVPSRYSDARQTPLRDVEVRPGAQTLDFDVKATLR
jgi:hypothetical protein